MLLSVPVNVIEMEDVLTSATTNMMLSVLIIKIVISTHPVIWTIFKTQTVTGFLDVLHMVHVINIIPVLLHKLFLHFPHDLSMK